MVSLTNRALVSFIAEENFAGLQHLLDSRKVVVDDRDENGATALMVAAQRGKRPFVRTLLEHGADINAEDADNWTALLFATKEGHEDIVIDLLDHGATVDHRDMGGWTALMWACYKGRNKAAHALIEKGADVNAYGNYNVSCLGWASGRNNIDIVKDLIRHGAKVNAGDKYGTTPMIWASRKGYLEIVDILLNTEANVDVCGMTSWTALIVATAGNHVEVVKALLEHKPNVNALDKDGCSSLTIACKEGFHEIAIALINAGAYININDRGGSSNLIHAAKGGHRSIVEALLKKHADVNVQGKDRKTALYWAVEKSHVGVVKLLLSANPDLELSTKDGDTPLMKATRNRNLEIVSLLLEKRAKVNAADKCGDTCLHIAMRARSKQIVELLLRNPVNSQLLYRPNRSGETPYNIDRSSAKPVITQLFGSRGLNTQEDFENLLGYNLYSSALADMLSDPTLNMPITVGLFARWGSGKSFLLGKLKEEMKSFARQWLNPLFTWSPLLFVIILCLASILGAVSGLSFHSWIIGLSFSIGIVLLIHTFLFVVWFCSQRSKFDWSWSHRLISYLATKIDATRLVFQVVFCHPAGSLSNDTIQALPINFYFTEQTKISSTTGGENSVIQMLASLYSCLENDYGTFSTRLFRAFRPKPVSAHAPWKWRKLCCIPYCIIFLLCFICSLVSIVVLCLSVTDMEKDPSSRMSLQILMYGCALFVGLLLVANLYTIGQVLKALVYSHRKHLQRTVSKMYAVKSEGFLYALKAEVNLMTDMVQCLDAFTGRQSRMVVIVDGLDSGEQDKVLQVLDAVHILFSDNKAPFIILLAIDPHIISKGIEMNINPVMNESNVGGQDYLRNLVHLPFYLQNAALRKVKQVKMLESSIKRKAEDDPGPQITLSTRRPSVESSFGVSLALDRFDKANSKKSKRLGLKMSDSVASSLGTNMNKIGAGPGDLKKMLLGDDYFSDVNPRSMRRLMNIIHITGRLLKAFNFDFNWHHLSTWVNVTEQWPYRLSWMIIYCEIFQKELDDSMSLKTVFERVKHFIPTSKEVDPNVALDRDEKKLDVYLGLHKSSLLVSTLYVFLPFTISLDPQLCKDITEQYQPTEQMFKQSPGSFKPALAIQPPPSPYINPNFNQNLRFRQSVRPQATLPQGAAIPPYYQHIVSSNGLGPVYSSMWPFPAPPVAQPTPSYLPPVIPPPDNLLVRELKSVKLSSLSVDEVVDLLCSLSSLKNTYVGKYQESIVKNNITGRVLLYCDLNELKGVLNMTFGDWELFKAAINILRENGSLSDAKLEGLTESNVRISVTSPDKERPGSAISVTTTKGESQELRKPLKPNVLEKQITMEDQMISGALELLNDEAKEDARKGEESLSNSTLSPINSEPEPLDGRGSSKGFDDMIETDVIYVIGNSANLTAEIPDSPAVIRKIESEKSQYSIINESHSRNSIASSATLNVTDLSAIQTSPRGQYSSQAQQQQVYHFSHQESPGRKRGSVKRNPLSRHQSAAGNISTAVTAHFRKKEDEVRQAKTPKMQADDRKKSSRKSQTFHIGGDTSTDVSSDESQRPLMSRNSGHPAVVVQPRKAAGSKTPRLGDRPSSPLKKRVSKEDSAASSRLSRIKSSIFGQTKEGEPAPQAHSSNQTYQGREVREARPGPGGVPALHNFRPGRDERYEPYATEDSSEPAMYYFQESRGKPWTQYRAPTPLPPFGSEEYYRVIKSSNPSPTTSNESEIGSSPEEISSGENLFFPEPPELPESPFPRRIGLSSVVNPPNGPGNYTGFTGNSFIHYGKSYPSTIPSGGYSYDRSSVHDFETVVANTSSNNAAAAAAALSVMLDTNPPRRTSSRNMGDPSHDFHNQEEFQLASQINLDVIKSSLVKDKGVVSMGEVSGRGSSSISRGRAVASSGEENSKHHFSSNQIGRTKAHLNLSDPVLSSRSNLTNVTSLQFSGAQRLDGASGNHSVIEEGEGSPVPAPKVLPKSSTPVKTQNVEHTGSFKYKPSQGEGKKMGGMSRDQQQPQQHQQSNYSFDFPQAVPFHSESQSQQQSSQSQSVQQPSSGSPDEPPESQNPNARGHNRGSSLRRQGEFDVHSHSHSSKDSTPTRK